MEYLLNVMTEIWSLMCEMSPYLLLGFLLAGLMHEFVPSRLYTQYLSQRSFRSVLLSALFGIPLPLCSCGVIPTAMGLRKEGASKGATLAFLTATPQTGVDSIIATYSLMGLPFAILRPIAALVTALMGGALCNAIDKEEECETECHNKKKKHSCEEDEGLMHRIVQALQYAFVEMMEDIGKWLVVGLVIAGLITTLVPDEWFMVFRDNTLYSILFVLLFSLPMYLCATGSIPIAVALMMKGLTPGAALVLLMAGPASNMASILVINKVLGKKTLAVYLVSIVAGAVIFALGIDYLLPREWFMTELIAKGSCCHEHLGLFSQICTVAMILLLANAFSPKKLIGGHEHCHCHCQDEEETEDAIPYIIYKVKGMNCNHCAANVRMAIEGLEGVDNVTVSLEKGEAAVSGNHNRDELLEAVGKLGFTINPA